MTEKSATLKVSEELKDALKVRAAQTKQGLNEMAADILQRWLAVPASESQYSNPVTNSEQKAHGRNTDVFSDTLSPIALSGEERGNLEALLYLLREGDPHIANAATGLLKPWFGRKLSAGDSAKAAGSSNKGNSARTGRGDANRTKRAG